MAKEKTEKVESCDCGCCTTSKNMNANAGGGAVYGLGFIGALIYFIQHATSFWVGVLGVLKAIVWPAVLIYQVLVNLKL